MQRVFECACIAPGTSARSEIRRGQGGAVNREIDDAADPRVIRAADQQHVGNRIDRLRTSRRFFCRSTAVNAYALRPPARSVSVAFSTPLAILLRMSVNRVHVVVGGRDLPDQLRLIVPGPAARK